MAPRILDRRGFLSAAAAGVAAGCTPRLVSTPASAGPLTVSADGRHLVGVDGRPFFWLADTAWELFHRLNLADAELYLEDRRRKGFTVIQAVALAELDGLRTPNANGDVPLIDLDPTRLNEPYFAHVDRVVALAAAKGLIVALLPIWGDKFNLKWGVGPEIFTPANARAYGALLAQRYRDQPIVWVLGGDRNPENATHRAIVETMADGIRSVVGQSQLITYHPQGSTRSWDFFGDAPWIDFHLFQSGHSARDLDNDAFTRAGRALSPVRPVIDGEPRYEDLPIDFKPANGWFDAFDVRQAGWWSMLAGAAGHSYGNHGIWQMFEPGRGAITHARTPWKQALDHPGAAQMGMMRRLLESVDFAGLEQADALLAANPGGGARQVAARHRDSGLVLAYTPFGAPVVLAGESVAGGTRYRWFDPRTGSLSARQRGDGATSRFVAPGAPGRGNDWLLLLEPARG